MNSLQIECFLSAARHLSFSRAAQERYISQPSVSKHIHNLEEDIGVPLFERTGRSPKLTAYGEQFYQLFSDYSQAFLSLQDRALKELAQNKQHIRLAFLQSSDFFEDLHAAFHKTIIENSFLLDVFYYGFQDIVSALLSGKVDIIFALEPFVPKHPDIHIVHLIDVPNEVIYRKDLFPDDRQPATLSDFRDCQFLVTNDIEPPDVNQKRFVQTIPFDFEPQFRYVPNIESLLWAVRHGQGAAIIDSSVSFPNLDDSVGRLRIPSCYYKIVMAYLNKTSNHAVLSFASQVISCLEPDY